MFFVGNTIVFVMLVPLKDPLCCLLEGVCIDAVDFKAHSFQVRMHISLECNRCIRVAHDFADSLDVAARLQAGRRKGVAQGMGSDRAHLRLFQVCMQALAETARLHRFFTAPGQKPGIIGGHPAQLTEQNKKILGDWDLTGGRSGFGRLDNDLGMPVTAADALDGSLNR